MTGIRTFGATLHGTIKVLVKDHAARPNDEFVEALCGYICDDARDDPLFEGEFEGKPDYWCHADAEDKKYQRVRSDAYGG